MLEIKTAGERAASLTQQLLAFSRRQVLQPKVLDLNAIVADFDRMLRRLVGERIKVVVDCAPALWQVRADPGEIGRAIMNLCLNARDAMPEGGTLTIETANATLTEADAGDLHLAPGRYVTMAVRDTGIGIDAEMRAHIFEPFFTTKETGKGTGLGLATVLGIVEQSGGAIRCESEPGVGTAFTIFLPAVAEAVDQGARPAGGLADAPKGTEVILLVEDEDAVRKLTHAFWRRAVTWSTKPATDAKGWRFAKPTRADRSAGDRRGYAGTRRTRARGGRPQAAARYESLVYVRAHTGCRPQGGHRKGSRIPPKAV